MDLVGTFFLDLIIVVHDARVTENFIDILCHGLDSGSPVGATTAMLDLQGQGHSAHMPKMSIQTITLYCHVGSR